MPRRFRLRNPQALVDVADADLARQQQTENPQPGRVGQRFEEPLEGGQWGGHIFALTNISQTPTLGISAHAHRSLIMADTPVHDTVKAAVRDKYGAIATSVGKTAAGPGACCGGSADPICTDLYSDAQTDGLPADAVAASLGCGNPTALLALEPARRSSTSARAAASTCCCRRAASARPARSTAST